MRKIDRLVNFFAKNSVPASGNNRFLRYVCRQLYQAMSECWTATSPAFINAQERLEAGDLVDTYPWPYRERWFADWEEDEARGTAVLDANGFIVRHDTSYCAWKVYEAVGAYILCPDGASGSDASIWRRLLSDAGFLCVLDRPQPGRPHIGISNRLSRNPEVIWYEGYDSGLGSIDREIDTDGYVIFTTYRDGKYFIGTTPADRYTWIQVGRRMTFPVL